jgi:hypothetical protein
LFLQIFNFFRNFESNLAFKLSGNSINYFKSRKQPSSSPPVAFRPLPGALAVTTSYSSWPVTLCVSPNQFLGRPIKLEEPVVVFRFPLLCFLTAAIAPPLAAASVEPSPANLRAPPSLPHSCAPIRPARTNPSRPEHPHSRFLPLLR